MKIRFTVAGGLVRWMPLILAMALVTAVALADPFDDASALVFEWLPEPAAEEKRPAFNNAVAEITGQAAAARAAAESLAFARDRLKFYRVQLDTGLIEEADLWKHAQTLTRAKQEVVRRRAEYALALIAVSREWGQDRWWELRDLLIAHTGWHPDECLRSQAVVQC